MKLLENLPIPFIYTESFVMGNLISFEQVGLMLAGMGSSSMDVFRMVHKDLFP